MDEAGTQQVIAQAHSIVDGRGCMRLLQTMREL
jgi:hypothetical protein